MFVDSEADAAAICAVGHRRVARRLFPGVTDNVQARGCARAIAG